MASERRYSDVTDVSESSDKELHAFEEQEEVNVAEQKEEMLAVFRRGMDSELNALRQQVNLLRESMSKMQVERDEAMKEAQRLRELLDVRENGAPSTTSVRSPARKIAKTSIASTRWLNDNSADFPALPANPGRIVAASLKPVSSANFTAASTSRHAAASAKPTISSNNAVVSKNYKKTLQAVNTDVFKVRTVLTASAVKDFVVKQSSTRGPVKIVINNLAEVQTAKSALAAAKVSFHEFKTPDERMKCFIIRGLVGAAEEDLASIEEELCKLGSPS